jgi:hypothetical protein
MLPAIGAGGSSVLTFSSIVMRPSGVLLSREMSKNTRGLACSHNSTSPDRQHVYTSCH